MLEKIDYINGIYLESVSIFAAAAGFKVGDPVTKPELDKIVISARRILSEASFLERATSGKS